MRPTSASCAPRRAPRGEPRTPRATRKRARSTSGPASAPHSPVSHRRTLRCADADRICCKADERVLFPASYPLKRAPNSAHDAEAGEIEIMPGERIASPRVALPNPCCADAGGIDCEDDDCALFPVSRPPWRAPNQQEPKQQPKQSTRRCRYLVGPRPLGSSPASHTLVPTSPAVTFAAAPPNLEPNPGFRKSAETSS